MLLRTIPRAALLFVTNTCLQTTGFVLLFRLLLLELQVAQICPLQERLPLLYYTLLASPSSSNSQLALNPYLLFIKRHLIPDNTQILLHHLVFDVGIHTLNKILVYLTYQHDFKNKPA